MSQTQAKRRREPISIKRMFNRYGILIIFLGLCLILSVATPNFLKVQNLINVVRQMAVIGIIGMGVTFCLITGGTDLSSGSVVGLVGIVAGAFAQQGGAGIVVAVVVGILTGTLTGLINGAIIVKGKIPPFIATLGMMTSARGAALLVSGGKPIANLSDGFLAIGQGSLLGVPMPIILFVLAGIATYIILSKLRFGRHVYAVGGNRLAATTCGIRSDRVLIMVYTLAGTMTGLAGIILTSRVGAAAPSAGQSYEFDAITAAVVGGTSFSGGVGKISGTMVGALVIGVLNNGMDLLAISPYWQQIVKGAIIVIAVVIDARRNKNFI